MVLGFKEQFSPVINAGIKVHTIREDKKKRWRQAVGKSLHMATGVRTKKYSCFNSQHNCKCTQRVDIEVRGNIIDTENLTVKVDGRELTLEEKWTLALNDGFNTLTDFFDWFKNGVEDGTIIHWTDLKY